MACGRGKAIVRSELSGLMSPFRRVSKCFQHAKYRQGNALSFSSGQVRQILVNTRRHTCSNRLPQQD